MSDITEWVARALFEANPTRNPALRWEHSACPKTRYFKQAHAVISVIEKAGYVIVPKEPTEAMLKHAYKGPIVSWQAMCDAALGEEEGK